jgi:RHS repeat-associated protein
VPGFFPPENEMNATGRGRIPFLPRGGMLFVVALGVLALTLCTLFPPPRAVRAACNAPGGEQYEIVPKVAASVDNARPCVGDTIQFSGRWMYTGAKSGEGDLSWSLGSSTINTTGYAPGTYTNIGSKHETDIYGNTCGYEEPVPFTVFPRIWIAVSNCPSVQSTVTPDPVPPVCVGCRVDASATFTYNPDPRPVYITYTNTCPSTPPVQQPVTWKRKERWWVDGVQATPASNTGHTASFIVTSAGTGTIHFAFEGWGESTPPDSSTIKTNCHETMVTNLPFVVAEINGIYPVTNCAVQSEMGNVAVDRGGTAQLIVETTPPNQPIAWSIVQTNDQAAVTITGDGRVSVDPNSGDGSVVVQAAIAGLSCTTSACRTNIEVRVACAACSTCKDRTAPPGICAACAYSSLTTAYGPLLNWKLGQDADGRQLGNVTLHVSSTNPTPEQLAVVLHPNTNLVRRIEHDGKLKQLKTPHVLVHFDTAAGGYDMKFFDATNLGNPGQDGLYSTNGLAPYAHWQVLSPNGDGNRLQVSRLGECKTTSFDYTFDGNNRWTTSVGELNQPAHLQVVATREAVSGTNVVTHEVRDANGNLASKRQRFFKQVAGQERLVKTVEDPDGAALASTWDYIQDGSPASGQVRRHVQPGGQAEEFEYDGAGRLAVERRSWGDGGTQEVSYVYTPHDAGDSEWTNAARTVITKINGHETARSHHRYSRNQNLDIVQTDEQCAQPEAAFGAGYNLRTEITILPYDLGLEFGGKPVSIQHSDGRLDWFAYEHGTYVPDENNPANWSFAAHAGGDAVQTVVTHGTVTQPDGVPHRGTRELSVIGPLGHPVVGRTEYTDGNQWLASAESVHRRDSLGRQTGQWSRFGGQSAQENVCCGPEWLTDPSGQQTRFEYDELGQVTHKTRVGTPSVNGHPAQPDLVTDFGHDPAGRLLFEFIPVGGDAGVLVRTNRYDLAGRLTNTVDQAGLVTTYFYSADGLTEIVVFPGGGTRITKRYPDGRTQSVTGTAVVHTHYVYEVNADGTQSTTVFTGPDGTNSPAWSRSVSDLLGRTIREEKPGFGGGALTNLYVYNAVGQIAETRVSSIQSQVSTVYLYNELGEQIVSALDVDGDGVVDYAGPDRVTSNNVRYITDGGNVYRRSESFVFAGENDGTALSTGYSLTRLTGAETNALLGVLTAEAISHDIRGNVTVSRTWTDATNKLVTQVVDFPDSTNDAVTVALNGLTVATTSKNGVRTDYFYDGIGRQTNVETRSGSPEQSRRVASTTHYNSKGQVDWTEDAASNRTWFAYDPATGRRIAVTKALGEVTETRYDVQGRVTNIWGATYPVAYGFDESGRIAEMGTWRQESGAPDSTRWLYDQATGLMTNKLYADTNGTAYVYQPDGKLQQRSWARGTAAEYDYSTCCGALTGIRYLAGGVPDGVTSNVLFGLDRLARQTSVTDAAGTWSYLFDPGTLALTNETLVSRDGATKTLDRKQDSQGRTAGIALNTGYSVGYAYNTKGELDQVTWAADGTTYTARYSFVEGSSLIAGYEISVGNGVLKTVRSYETNRDLIVSVSNLWNSTPISAFAYGNDAVGRRTSRVDAGTTTNLFAYNARSELTNALMGASSFSWMFDNIGNRQTAVKNSTAYGYAANQLNQYAQITNGGPGTPSYDLDGNLLEDAGWSFAWDGENRLISATNGTTLVTFAYDHMSRRISKRVYSFETDHWTLITDHCFQYDGWNLIQERITDHGSLTTNSYIWGLDISGSLQGAGGIGGLLCAIHAGTPYFPVGDANGNITEYVDSTGQTVAHYEYGAFGELLASSGVKKDGVAHRFSSKFFDSETDLGYWGYRYYSAELGRWLNRDTIEELGGIHPYLAVGNDCIDNSDSLGLVPVRDAWIEQWIVDSRGVKKRQDLIDGVKGRLEALCAKTDINGVPCRDRCGNCTEEKCKEEAQQIARTFVNTYYSWANPYRDDPRHDEHMGLKCYQWATVMQNALGAKEHTCWTIARVGIWKADPNPRVGSVLEHNFQFVSLGESARGGSTRPARKDCGVPLDAWSGNHEGVPHAGDAADDWNFLWDPNGSRTRPGWYWDDATQTWIRWTIQNPIMRDPPRRPDPSTGDSRRRYVFPSPIL